MKWQTKGVFFLSLSSFLFLVLLGCLIASCVLGDFLGSTPIFEGDCNVAGPVNSGVHVIIVTLSILVMLSSDFFVRLAAAPQRSDIIAAHQKAKWMEVGVNSMRNLKYLPQWAGLPVDSRDIDLDPTSALFQRHCLLDCNFYELQSDPCQQRLFGRPDVCAPGRRTARRRWLVERWHSSTRADVSGLSEKRFGFLLDSARWYNMSADLFAATKRLAVLSAPSHCRGGRSKPKRTRLDRCRSMGRNASYVFQRHVNIRLRSERN